MKFVSLAVLASSALASVTTNALDRRAPSGSYASTLSKSQRELFLWGMDALDNLYSDPLIFDSPRYSAWYAVGLLARNGKGDVDEAKKIIREAISYQWKDPSHEWFGTFKNRISAPDPSDIWTPKLYTSFDPNQGTFVVCAFIIAMEEFQHLLDRSLVQLMKESMYNATIGEGNRIAGQNNDNIWPIYSNPFYMRVTSATYVGNMMGDKNMTKWAEIWAEQAIYEFDQYDTISEFNSGTYTGVSLWVLSLYGYLPKSSLFYKRAPDMIAKSWQTLGEVYNPTLHSLSGPFDRSFGVNMRSYFGMLGAQITGLIGGLSDRTAPLPVPLYPGGHLGDAASLAIIPLSSKFHDKHVPKEVIRKLAKLDKPHTHFEQALSPPFDNRGYPRNYTFYVGNGISTGGIVTDSCVVGGAAMNQGQHVPAVIMWDAGVEMGWFQLYSTNSYTHAVATASTLTVSYPPSVAFAGNASLPISNQMTFMLSGQRRHTLPVDFMSAVGYSYELNGLRLTLKDSNIVAGSKFSYGVGTWNDLQYYNLTYTVPAGLGATPFVQFEFEKINVKTKRHDEEL